MPLYESLFYMAPRAGYEATKQVLRDRANLIFKNNGFIRRLDNMGILPLAYPMYRHGEKYFEARAIYMLIDAGKECLTEMDRDLRECNFIFRHAIYHEKNKFRDAFEEMYIHHGIESGKTLEAREKILSDMEYDVALRLEQADNLKSVEKVHLEEEQTHWNFMNKWKERLVSINNQRDEAQKLQEDREAEKMRISEQQRSAIKKRK